MYGRANYTFASRLSIGNSNEVLFSFERSSDGTQPRETQSYQLKEGNDRAHMYSVRVRKGGFPSILHIFAGGSLPNNFTTAC